MKRRVYNIYCFFPSFGGVGKKRWIFGLIYRKGKMRGTHSGGVGCGFSLASKLITYQYIAK